MIDWVINTKPVKASVLNQGMLLFTVKGGTEKATKEAFEAAFETAFEKSLEVNIEASIDETTEGISFPQNCRSNTNKDRKQLSK